MFLVFINIIFISIIHKKYYSAYVNYIFITGLCRSYNISCFGCLWETLCDPICELHWCSAKRTSDLINKNTSNVLLFLIYKSTEHLNSSLKTRSNKGTYINVQPRTRRRCRHPAPRAGYKQYHFRYITNIFSEGCTVYIIPSLMLSHLWRGCFVCSRIIVVVQIFFLLSEAVLLSNLFIYNLWKSFNWEWN